MRRQKKREVSGTEGGTVCHFKGIETTTHILLYLSCVTVYLLAKFDVWMCNLSIFMYVLYNLSCCTPRYINIFLSMFAFSFIMCFIGARDYKTTSSSSEFHWNTEIAFHRSTVHAVHSYTDVREQKTLPSAAAVLSLGPHLNSFLTWGSSWDESVQISQCKYHCFQQAPILKGGQCSLKQCKACSKNSDQLTVNQLRKELSCFPSRSHTHYITHFLSHSVKDTLSFALQVGFGIPH